MAIHIHHHYHDHEVEKLLKEVIWKLNKVLEAIGDEKIKQEIMDKLEKAIADIKSTIKN